MRRSVYNVNFISEDELMQQSRRRELRNMLGILDSMDSQKSKNIETKFLEVVTLYKSIDAYNIDRSKAIILINNNKRIPSELYNKLLQTKIELEKAGLLEDMQ